MAQDVSFSCKCGAVRGAMLDVSQHNGTHLVCHCSDCQDFARFLGAADRVLDEHGGTSLYQSRCAKLRIDEGAEKLSSLHLTDKPTLRWYASCCRSPIFNTFKNAKLPYVTVLLAALDEGGRAQAGAALGHLHLADAPGDTSGLEPMNMWQMLRKFFPRLIKDVFSGARRRSPLFDAETMEPIAAPHHLTPEERAAGEVA